MGSDAGVHDRMVEIVCTSVCGMAIGTKELLLSLILSPVSFSYVFSICAMTLSVDG